MTSYPVWAEQDLSAVASAGYVTFGLAVLALPVVEWTGHLAPLHPERSVSSSPGAVEIRLRTAPPLATAVIGVTWAGFFGWAWLAGGPTSGGLLAVPCLLLFLALVPDSVRAITRRPFLRVDADRVVLRGWSIDARVDWSDVLSVDLPLRRRRRPVVRLVAAPAATSLQRTWQRLAVRLDTPSSDPYVDLPFAALDDPVRVSVFLTILQGLARAERVEQLDGPGLAALTFDRADQG